MTTESPHDLPDADAIELSEPAFWMRPPPEREPYFAALRRDRPISFHQEFEPPPEIPIPRGPGYYAITRHADILEVSRTPEVYCSGKGTQIPDQPPAFNEFFGSMINMDDPRHGRLRRIVARGFTPKTLARVEDEVQRLATKIVDDVHEKGACDFVTEIAAPLPLAIICDMMGIPESQRQFVFEQTNVILGLGDPEYVPPGKNLIVAALEAGKGLADLMYELAEIRQKEPKDDLTSQLIHAELEGDRLSHQELASFFVLLVVAGNETTRNAVSHGMKALSDFPDERRKWLADFDGLAPTAVEEIVRWSSPVLHFRRTLARDAVLADQALEEGDKVVLWYHSGNRDERAFDHPERFDVARTPNEHVGFGGPGPHFCLGAQLARREIRVLMREILTRLPDLEITAEPDWLRSNFIHGIKHMPCAWKVGG